MRRKFIILLPAFFFFTAIVQAQSTVQRNTLYAAYPVGKDRIIAQTFRSEPYPTAYQVLLRQHGIDVMIEILDSSNKVLFTQDNPNGRFGEELLHFRIPANQHFTFRVVPYDDSSNPDSGSVSFYIRQYAQTAAAEYERFQTARKKMPEPICNTSDIDHFWEAWDKLKSCKSAYDSLVCLQHYYIDRGSPGLDIFRKDGLFDAFSLLNAVRDKASEYVGIRAKTAFAKQAAPQLKAVFEKFSQLYTPFKPVRVCFPIGIFETGGIAMDGYVIIGTELTTSGDTGKIPMRIRGIVAHESVHLQQASALDSNAVVCVQLQRALREGSANFIGELLSGTSNYNFVNQYGLAHEQALWNEFKSTLCYPSAEKWLYNAATTKDRPADLGYFIGYQITKHYYDNSPDKRRAIAEIIECTDPLSFLIKSGYDKRWR